MYVSTHHSYFIGSSEGNSEHAESHDKVHLGKPRVLCPLRSLRTRNEVGLVPLDCEDGHSFVLTIFILMYF